MKRAIRVWSILISLSQLTLSYAGDSNMNDFENLQKNDKIKGFIVESLYEDGTGKAMGGRFVSERYGFVVDLLSIQSVPQAFFWIKTPAKWDKGEPHTCEHLLLGKGATGKHVAALEEMSLGNSTAFTARLLTAYHFNTTSGEDVFYDLFAAKLNALIHPDFTDEEIRREVGHVGVVVDSEDGSLSLEEKGTVYTEMVSSFEKHWYYQSSKMNGMLYGENHPIANISGGEPSAILTMTPEDMWEFHRDFYRLDNMGGIVSLPNEIDLKSTLKELSKILEKVGGKTKKKVNTKNQDWAKDYQMTNHKLPVFETEPEEGKIIVAGYPDANTNASGHLDLSWQPTLEYDLTEAIALRLFLGSLISGESSNFYDYFINSETRQADYGVNAVWGWVSDNNGHSISINFRLTDNSWITEESITEIRRHAVGLIKEIYNYADGSEELRDFNNEVKSQLAGSKKSYDQMLNSPPMFGFRRGRAGAWLYGLKELEMMGNFRKSLTRERQVSDVEKLLDSDENFWKPYIDKWNLLEVTPFAVGIKPDPEMLEDAIQAKDARIRGYIDGYKAKYGVDTEAEAIAKYKEEFDKNTALLEAGTADQEIPKFISNPPMTLDDQLDYEVIKTSDGSELVASTFENITTSTLGAAFNMNVIAERDLVYVPFLPSILTSIGVVKNGEVIEFDEMQTQRRLEISDLSAYFDSRQETGRIELVLRGSANSSAEIEDVIGWMSASLFSPLLATSNLSRLTDIIDQRLVSLRNVMKGGEESWVNNPTDAYLLQDQPLYLATNSLLTMVHYYQRLRWMLADAGGVDSRTVLSRYLDDIAEAVDDLDREALIGLFGVKDAKHAKNEEHVTDRIKDRINQELIASLADIPDENLVEDWKYLCALIKSDLLTEPQVALDGFKRCLNLVTKSDNVRYFMISNQPDGEKFLSQLPNFSKNLDSGSKSVRVEYSDTRNFENQLVSRVGGEFDPVYVGLVNENTRNGVLLFSVKCTEPYDTSREAILSNLSANLFSGYAAHGLFMKTWASGLAYNNGIRFRENSGRLRYYAERCPDVTETMKFIISEVKKGLTDPALTDYVTAICFSQSRAPSRYETRGEQMAQDLVDGFGPDVITRHRAEILKISQEEGLFEELNSRLEEMYGKVMIGYGEPLSADPESNFFLIGPEEQFESLESYIKSVEMPRTVYRLYPRDFWIRMPVEHMRDSKGVETGS